jgi:predicted CopG family antitoxin
MEAMASKTISITDVVYEKLSKIKGKDESFSELFIRMIDLYHQNQEKCFGSWNLSLTEKKEIWDPIITRPERKWHKVDFGDN